MMMIMIIMNDSQKYSKEYHEMCNIVGTEHPQYVTILWNSIDTTQLHVAAVNIST